MASVTNLPEKVPGDHRWLVIVAHTVSAADAKGVYAGDCVSLGPHNIMSVQICCADCELDWEDAAVRCTAAADPAFDDLPQSPFITSTQPLPSLTLDDRVRITAALVAVARAGGQHFGFDFSDPPPGWSARATVDGDVVAAETCESSVTAVETLLAMVVERGTCVACDKPTMLLGAGERATDAERCAWRRVVDCYVPGCLPPEQLHEYIRSRRVPVPGMNIDG